MCYKEVALFLNFVALSLSLSTFTLSLLSRQPPTTQIQPVSHPQNHLFTFHHFILFSSLSVCSICSLLSACVCVRKCCRCHHIIIKIKLYASAKEIEWMECNRHFMYSPALTATPLPNDIYVYILHALAIFSLSLARLLLLPPHNKHIFIIASTFSLSLLAFRITFMYTLFCCALNRGGRREEIFILCTWEREREGERERKMGKIWHLNFRGLPK